MTYVTVSQFLVALFGLTITFGLYDQANRIRKTRDTNNLSKVLVFTVVLLEIAYLNYGVAIQQWPLLLGAGLNLPAAIYIAIYCWRNKNDSQEN